jgi:hypothetical protein
VIHNFSNQAFNDISSKIIKNKNISLFKSKKHLDKLVPIKPKYHEMCINSCCLFYGKYNSNYTCPFCDEPRYINKKGRKHMPYLSLIERLKIQFNNKERVKELLYRSEYTSMDSDDDEIIGDIFDGKMYKELCEKGFFEDRRELALTVSCDGYQIFKQKTDDNWVFLVINNNLAPEVRVKKENLIISFIIPGPNQPKDFNSFLQPFIEEMKTLQG